MMECPSWLSLPYRTSRNRLLGEVRPTRSKWVGRAIRGDVAIRVGHNGCTRHTEEVGPNARLPRRVLIQPDPPLDRNADALNRRPLHLQDNLPVPRSPRHARVLLRARNTDGEFVIAAI